MTTETEHQTLKAKALKLLSRRDHSRFELQQKLAQFSKNTTQINAVLTECLKNDWLNELRFVQAYIRYRAGRYYGPRKIRYELQQRGVDDSTIEAGFAQSEVDWTTLAELARQRKFATPPADSWLERGKQNDYLYQRGF